MLQRIIRTLGSDTNFLRLYWYNYWYTSFSACLKQCHIRTCIADTRIVDRNTLTALLISHPLQFGSLACLLQSCQSSKQDPDGMSPANGILRLRQVFREVVVGGAPCIWRARQDFHGFVVESRDGLVDREVCLRSMAVAAEPDACFSISGVIEGVLESRPPAEHACKTIDRCMNIPRSRPTNGRSRWKQRTGYCLSEGMGRGWRRTSLLFPSVFHQLGLEPP